MELDKLGFIGLKFSTLLANELMYTNGLQEQADAKKSARRQNPLPESLSDSDTGDLKCTQRVVLCR